VLGPAALAVFQQQRGRVARLCAAAQAHHARAGEHAHVGCCGEALAVRARQRRQVGAGAVAPDLAAGGGVVVHQHDGGAAGRGGQRCRHAGRAGADDEDVAALHGRGGGLRCAGHGRCVAVSMRMPSRHTVWQASWRRPSMVTRHSWQMPMPQNGARGSPLTDRRERPVGVAASAAATLLPAGHGQRLAVDVDVHGGSHVHRPKRVAA
jgi:hypothetical protein